MHEHFIKALRAKEPLGRGAHGRELERLYAREGRSGSYEDFLKNPMSPEGRLAAQWVSERIDRLGAMAQARWREGDTRAKLMEKAGSDLLDNVHNPVRLELLQKSLQQDIANYTSGQEPSLRHLTTPEAQTAFKELVNDCRREALRRQHELNFLLDDTVQEVKAERARANAWLDPATVTDGYLRKQLVEARAEFDQAVANADTFLRDWSKMLKEEPVPDPERLKRLLDNDSLKKLYNVAIRLFNGLDHQRASTTAYRLPAVIEAIGERLTVQGQAHSDVAAYGLIAARLAEVPNRDPMAPQAEVFARHEYYKKPGSAFGYLAEDCLKRNVAAVDNESPAAGQTLRALFGPDGSAGQVVGKLDEAAYTLMQKGWTVINKPAYAAVADLTFRLRSLKDTIAAQLAENKPAVVAARAEAEGIIDGAVAYMLQVIALKVT
jgi:hypothetical protein